LKQHLLRSVLMALLTLAFAAPAGAEPADEIKAIGVENEYADVIAQVGGKYVHVQAIQSDPTTGPHSFEASPKIAREIAAAQLIVENGVGYDDWANKIISASPKASRHVGEILSANSGGLCQGGETCHAGFRAWRPSQPMHNT
jgi:zinc/manganese transport system substrate-binding protein